LLSKKLRYSYIGVYNFENLFDTINDPNTNDDEWTQKERSIGPPKVPSKAEQTFPGFCSEIGSSETRIPTFYRLF
jgi:hypothetical protein